jgi:hypothetical protein
MMNTAAAAAHATCSKPKAKPIVNPSAAAAAYSRA